MRGDTEELFGCRRGRAEMEVMTDTSLGQSVVSVRQDCSMLGVLFPARSTMALKALFRGILGCLGKIQGRLEN